LPILLSKIILTMKVLGLFQRVI